MILDKFWIEVLIVAIGVLGWLAMILLVFSLGPRDRSKEKENELLG